MVENKINVAVIGCGAWGPNHIRNFSTLPNSRVVGVADVSAANLERIGNRFPGLSLTTNYRELLAQPSVDAVVVATPTRTHYEIVEQCLRAKKHVLCEKPLCDDSGCAAELARLADQQQCVLMVGHVFLFNASIIMLKEMVAGGQLGPLQYMTSVRTNLGPIRQDVNAAYDLASHDIAIFNWLVGEVPRSVSATGAAYLQPGIEDIASISLRYNGNVTVNIFVSWLSPKKVRQITVVGKQKMVTWDDLELSVPLAIYDKGAAQSPDYASYGEFLRVNTWDGEVRLPKIKQEEPLLAQARFFLKSIAAKRIERSDGHFAVDVVRVLEAVRKSLAAQGAPVNP